ncbi:MAG: T9SS type A sorting domain-containing protein [Flavobacteriales bacterium]|nr:T9SS type A sorting domain-containing protein [Flavobacteriales bacterium]
MPDRPYLPLGPQSIAERGGGPVIIPTLVHVHYSDIFYPITPDRIANAIDQCNAFIRAQNDDLDQVHPAFADLVGDLGVELRLATIDANGQCTSGILYYDHGAEPGIPDVWSQAQNTASYLNIHVSVGPSSWTIVPFPGAPVSGDPGDGIFFTTYDAQFRPEVLAHEVGHWLGLYHTFGQTNTSGVDCGDDWIADTPITKGSLPESCDTSLSECTAGVIENVDNHMDYSLCGKMFTQGQAQHVGAVVMDPTIARYPLHQPANLASTGVFLPPACDMSTWAWHRLFPNCDSSRVQLFALASGRIPDSLQWSFPGGSPATSTSTVADVFYFNTGTYTAQLTSCIDGSCTTVDHSISVVVNNSMSNGLQPITSLPFTEDFENGFSLPQPHMFAVNDGTPTWQPCGFAGYASANSLYVPAEAVTQNDTCDLVLGNFEFSGLTTPTLSFKIAATQYDFAWWHTLEIRFRQLCGTNFSPGAWQIWQLNEMNVPNSTSGFTPTTDAEWVTLSTAFPVWNTAGPAELTLRLRRPWMPFSFTPEGFWLDDLYIGEAMIPTGIPEFPDEGSLLAPNPTSGSVKITPPPGTDNYELLVHDPTGREVLHHSAVTGSLALDLSSWAKGMYLVGLRAGAHWQRSKLIVE